MGPVLPNPVWILPSEHPEGKQKVFIATIDAADVARISIRVTQH